MITYRAADRRDFALYDQIDMAFSVSSEYRAEKPDSGLGGILLRETAVKPYRKDLGQYEKAADYEKRFDISHWQFYMAFDGEKPVGGITLAARTPGVDMLGGRDDLCVVWDLRVREGYRGQGIGQRLWDLGEEWSRAQGMTQIKVECQNNNVRACRFYRKQGAVLSAIDEYAYYGEAGITGEIQLIWYKDLRPVPGSRV